MLIFSYKNNIDAQIIFSENDKRDFDILRECFKTENKGAIFAKFSRYKASPFIYAITPLGKYSVGLTQELTEKCDKLKIEYSIDERLYKIIKPSFNINEIEQVPNEKYRYRDYQENLIHSLLDNGRRSYNFSNTFRKIISYSWFNS